MFDHRKELKGSGNDLDQNIWDKVKDQFFKYKMVIAYLFFGVCTTIISIASFWYCNDMMQMNEHTANIISWILAVLFAYITNRSWVFNSEVRGLKAVVKEAFLFYAARITTLLVEEIGLFIFITILMMNGLMIKTAMQFVVVVLNYIFSKIIVFKSNDR